MSLTESQLICWEPGKHKLWMRPKHAGTIQHKPWDAARETVRDRNKGFGFYDALENFNRCYSGAALLVGLRATESMHRWHTMIKHPVTIGGERVYWATGKGANTALYPLYDWMFTDVWRYIHEQGLRYSKIYDHQFRKGTPINEIRVSSLIHEKSFKALCDLPEFPIARTQAMPCNLLRQRLIIGRMEQLKRACELLGGVSAMARRIGMKPPTVHQWVTGTRPVPASVVPAIERETNGAVRRWDLRPDDWHRIWPELIGADGAPAIPQSEEVRDAA